MDGNLPEEDFDFDDADDAWDSDVDNVQIEPIVSLSDAHGRPYSLRRQIEEWQERRALREFDDLDEGLI